MIQKINVTQKIYKNTSGFYLLRSQQSPKRIRGYPLVSNHGSKIAQLVWWLSNCPSKTSFESHFPRLFPMFFPSFAVFPRFFAPFFGANVPCPRHGAPGGSWPRSYGATARCTWRPSAATWRPWTLPTRRRGCGAVWGDGMLVNLWLVSMVNINNQTIWF